MTALKFCNLKRNSKLIVEVYIRYYIFTQFPQFTQENN